MNSIRFSAPAVLLVAVALAYGNSLQGGFHYDDVHSIVANPHIRHLDDIPGYFASLSPFSADSQKGMYRPLLLVTYALNYYWSGYSTLVFHSTNLALHLACSLLVWSILLKIGFSARTALVSSLLFALHPLATEPVNYVSSRSETLAALFLLGAFRLRLQQSTGSEWMALTCFALGLLSKSLVMVFLGISLLYGICVESTSVARQLRRDARFWGVGALYLILVWNIGFLSSSLKQPVRALDVQLWTQVKAMIKYADLVSMPVALNVEHQFFESRVPWEGAVVASLLFLGSLAVLVGRHSSRENLFWIGWIPICLAPTLLVPLNVLVNEHRLYLPMVALAVLFARLFEQMTTPAKPICYLLLPTFFVLAFQRNNAWADEVSLWTAAAKDSPLMPRVHVELGNALRLEGKREAARQRYRRALELDVRHRAARTNLANIFYEDAINATDRNVAQEHFQAAAVEYEKVLELDPEYREALNSLGNIYAAAEDHERAVTYYHKTIQLYPNFPEAYYNLAATFAAQGRLAEASEMYRESINLVPNDAEAYLRLGNVQVRLGDLGSAQTAYREALALNGGEAIYIYSLAEVLLASGERADRRSGRAQLLEAGALYGQLEDSSPGYRKVRDRLAKIDRYLNE